MGIGHADFFRIIPRVMGDKAYRIDGTILEMTDGPRRLEIHLSEEQSRKLGPLVSLPYTFVELRFHAFTEQEREDFLAVFDFNFFRGGG